MITENYDKFTRQAYEYTYSFPLSLYMRKEQKNSISHLLDSLGFNNKEVV
jgi:hypothetical protein